MHLVRVGRIGVRPPKHSNFIVGLTVVNNTGEQTERQLVVLRVLGPLLTIDGAGKFCAGLFGRKIVEDKNDRSG